MEMDEMEKVFAEGLRKAASGRPVLPVDIDEVVARGEAAGRAPVRRPAWRWLAVAAAVLLVAGVGVAYLNRPGTVPAVPVGSPSAALVLTGTRWLATEIGGEPVEENAGEWRGEKVPWLEFDATTMSGGDPCNGVGADYRLDGDQLSFSNWGAHTDMGCNTDQQQRFEQALMDTTRVQRDGDELVFLDAGGSAVARFRGQTTVKSASLTGTVWVLTDFWDANTHRTSVDASVAPTLLLVDDRVEVDSPCGRFTADYTSDTDRLTVGELAITGTDCAADGKIPWFALRAVVAGPVTYRITDTTLELSDDHGDRLARFAASDSATPTSPATGVASAYRLRVYNGTGVALDHVRVQPRTGDAVDLGSLKAESTSELVVVPWADDQAVVTASAGDVRYSFTQDSYRGEAEWKPGDYTYILRLGGDGRTFFEFSGWARATTGPGVVQVRVRNASSHDFTGVVVVFPDGTRTGFGDLAAGAASDFVDVADPVYSYAYVEAKVAGNRLVFQPTDYVGEKALDPGAYTYALSIDDEGGLSLSLEKDG